jgi:hypothetical protein
MAAGSPIDPNAAIHAASVRWAVEEALPTAGAVLGKVNKGEVEVFIGSNVCLSFYVILVAGIGPQTINRRGGRRSYRNLQ